ncbi:uncharacterized protein LOC116846312 [Odontomachus brunneus]|uniref:uncharacterized protein LOC116846312 n=1 Tax=Odontomachus brunneus TaxID=486640 RepID=UPI0013F20D0D|nr:uncharacterized protein LOC116846312 [Odontomachus brunneus]
MGVTVIAALILYVVIAKVIAASVITPATDTSSYLDVYDESIAKADNNNCGCIQFDCGCCQYVKWNIVPLNGKLCANVSYWEHEYGISVTVTYNDFVIFNETVSARNPPPICFGEDIVDLIEVGVCLHIYDIDIGYNMFHACFEVLGEFIHMKALSIKLGCVTTKLQKQLEYVDDDRVLQLLHKRKIKDLKIPNVVMV